MSSRRFFVFYRGLQGRLCYRVRVGDDGPWGAEETLAAEPLPHLGPGATQWGQDRVALFHPAGDGSLTWRCWQPGAPEWQDQACRSEGLTSHLASSPAPVAWGREGQELSVLWAGPDRRLRARRRQGDSWTSEETVGDGELAPHSGPAAAPLGPDGVAVFYLRRLHRREFPVLFWRRWQEGTGWGPEAPIPEAGHLTSAPDVVPWNGGLAVFYWRPGAPLERQGLFCSRRTPHEGWRHETEPIGGMLASKPAATAWGEGIVLFYAGATGALFWNEWQPEHGWRGEEHLGGVLTSHPTAAVVEDECGEKAVKG